MKAKQTIIYWTYSKPLKPDGLVYVDSKTKLPERIFPGFLTVSPIGGMHTCIGVGCPQHKMPVPFLFLSVGNVTSSCPARMNVALHGPTVLLRTSVFYPGRYCRIACLCRCHLLISQCPYTGFLSAYIIDTLRIMLYKYGAVQNIDRNIFYAG